MSWLHRLFAPAPEMPPEVVARLQAWRREPPVNDRVGLDNARFVVVDSETSGLDPRRDRLLALAAVPLENGRVLSGEGREWVLQTEAATDRANILIHGLGPEAQAAGQAPALALASFLEFVGKAPLVAFHANFDRRVIERAARSLLGVRLPNYWLDLARLAPALVPEARLAQGALDDWLVYFDLQVSRRHRAGDDALATAELFLILLTRARRQEVAALYELMAACAVPDSSALGAGVGGP